MTRKVLIDYELLHSSMNFVHLDHTVWMGKSQFRMVVCHSTKSGRSRNVVQNLTMPFSSMSLSYLHLSLCLSTSDMYENTIDPPPTWSNYFSIKFFEIIHVTKTYHIEKNVIRRTIVDGQHCEMANPI